jgi:predicted amidohydrolase
MKVALAQVASPDEESRDDRIRRVETILRSIREADLIVLPELWSAGYCHFDKYGDLAETLDGPTISMCAAVARQQNSYMQVGSIVERLGDGRLQNTSVLLDPAGEIVHRYSKVHVFGYESLEADLLTPGSALPVAETPYGTIAGTTCYDLRFPGLWIEMSRRGADLVTVPAAWPAARLAHWRLFTSARAVEHQIFVIACNAAGSHGGVELAGNSRVVDPSGVVLGECGASEEVLEVEIDPAHVASVRSAFPVIRDRLSTYDHLTH